MGKNTNTSSTLRPPSSVRRRSFQRSSRRSAAFAAWWPHMPCTPAPGGVDAEQRYAPSPSRYGCRVSRGRGEQLEVVERAARDVAADEVGVRRFEIASRAHRSSDDDVAKPRREPLDLRVDRLARVERRCCRHVAVRPERVHPLGRASRVAHRRLRDEHERGASRLGRSTHRASLVAISAIEPPRWSVPARRASSAVQGTGSLSA